MMNFEGRLRRAVVCQVCSVKLPGWERDREREERRVRLSESVVQAARAGEGRRSWLVERDSEVELTRCEE